MKEILPRGIRPRLVSPAVYMMRRGRINFNRPACLCMGLKPGDRIAFYQDETRSEDWYVRKHPNGRPLRPVSSQRDDGMLCVFWSEGVRLLFESIEYYDESATIPVSASPNEEGLYALITKALTSNM